MPDTSTPQAKTETFSFDQKYNLVPGPLTQRFERIIDKMRDDESEPLVTSKSKESKSSQDEEKSQNTHLSQYQAHQ